MYIFKIESLGGHRNKAAVVLDLQRYVCLILKPTGQFKERYIQWLNLFTLHDQHRHTNATKMARIFNEARIDGDV